MGGCLLIYAFSLAFDELTCDVALGHGMFETDECIQGVCLGRLKVHRYWFYRESTRVDVEDPPVFK